jgi:hypothetical protein
MGLLAVLDANVLLPAPLRDTLLRLAEAELYVPKWSDRISPRLAPRRQARWQAEPHERELERRQDGGEHRLPLV